MSNEYRGIGGGGFPYKTNANKSMGAMNAVPPPPNLNINTRNVNPLNPVTKASTSNSKYMSLSSISQYTTTHNALGKRKAHTEDDYFDDDEEQNLAYIPAPGSPGAAQKAKNDDSGDDEDDPLDQFMAGIEQQVQKEKVEIQQTKKSKDVQQDKGVRHDIDDEDDEESYYRYVEENPNAGLRDDGSDAEIEYDEDGNPIAPPKKKDIDPLPPIDHTEIEYEPFEKNFYVPHEEIANLDEQKVRELRNELGLKVSGPEPPKPVSSFAHFGFDELLMKSIRRSGYYVPSPIQAQAVPVALSGRDIIGIAKTGSGKTAAFVWPMLVHIMDQRELRAGDGPIALVLAPTRELALQIYNETKRLGKFYNLRVTCCYGGSCIYEQNKALAQGVEIVIATPGRMIDAVKSKATNLRRVTFLVLDEADRMFDMGFEPQVRSICNHVRPDRQTLLFSATFKKRIERLARDVLSDPVRIVQGEINEANQDVTQHVYVFPNIQHKWNWLIANLVKFLSEGSVLVFVTKKVDAETVATNLMVKEYNCLLLHGDMEQADRNKVITKFKRKEADILVATDVAARGLDIPHIRNVINYDIARDIETHTHRIGRTGRAGEKGTAHTLVTEKDKEFAGHLVRNLEGADQDVPPDLMELAMKSSWFRSSRFKKGKGKRLPNNFAGFGFNGSLDGGGSAAGGNTHPAPGVNPFSSAKPASPKGNQPTNRLAALRQAFRSQYMTNFRAASDRTWEQNVTESGAFAATAPSPDLAAAATAGTGTGTGTGTDIESDAASTEKRAKRSRWN